MKHQRMWGQDLTCCSANSVGHGGASPSSIFTKSRTGVVENPVWSQLRLPMEAGPSLEPGQCRITPMVVPLVSPLPPWLHCCLFPFAADRDQAVLPVPSILTAGENGVSITPQLGPALADAEHPKPAQREFPLQTHHKVSFHGNRSRIAFFQITWGLSGHVPEGDKGSAAGIETQTAYFTPHLDIFVTHLAGVQTSRAKLSARGKPVPAAPHPQETPLPGLHPLAASYPALNCCEKHSGEAAPQVKPMTPN